MTDINKFLTIPVIVTSLPATGIQVEFTAEAKDCNELAMRHNVLQILCFKFWFKLTPWKKSGIKLKGQLQADIIQECSVTLAPVSYKIQEEIELFFVVENDKLFKKFQQQESHELFLDPEGPDLPEVFDGKSLDVGKIAEEFFELAIPTYPKCQDIEFQDKEINLEIKSKSEKKVSQFDMLSNLKKDKNK